MPISDASKRLSAKHSLIAAVLCEIHHSAQRVKDTTENIRQDENLQDENKLAMHKEDRDGSRSSLTIPSSASSFIRFQNNKSIINILAFMNLTLNGVMQGPTGTAYASPVIEVNS